MSSGADPAQDFVKVWYYIEDFRSWVPLLTKACGEQPYPECPKVEECKNELMRSLSFLKDFTGDAADLVAWAATYDESDATAIGEPLPQDWFVNAKTSLYVAIPWSVDGFRSCDMKDHSGGAHDGGEGSYKDGSYKDGSHKAGSHKDGGEGSYKDGSHKDGDEGSYKKGFKEGYKDGFADGFRAASGRCRKDSFTEGYRAAKGAEQGDSLDSRSSWTKAGTSP